MLFAGLFAVSAMAPHILNECGDLMVSVFALVAHPHSALSAAGLHGLVSLMLKTFLKAVLPVAGICMAAGVALNILQVGLRFTPNPLRPSFGVLNPINGFRSLFSPRTTVALLRDLAKVAVVGGFVAVSLLPDLSHPAASVGTTPYGLGVLMASGVKAIAMRAAAAYLVIGASDFAWQRHQFERDLRMTKQEVRDESRQRDLPPEVKRAIRRRQFQAARARMMSAVPHADVVVTNPTHYAVALEYDGEHPAPNRCREGQGPCRGADPQNRAGARRAADPRPELGQRALQSR